jgi:hypothetical protein
MTSPHDQPLSRRAARQAEHAEPGAPDAFAQPPGTDRAGSQQVSGVPSSVPSSSPSDIDYRTHIRPRVPHYDERVDPVQPIIVQPVSAPPLAPPAAPASGSERVRRRDFRPPAAADAGEVPVAPAMYDAPLDYRTQLAQQPTGPSAPLLVSDPPPQHHVIAPVDPSPVSNAPVEQTLSRRELREMRAALAEPNTEATIDPRTTTEHLLAAYPAPTPEFRQAPTMPPPAPPLVEPVITVPPVDTRPPAPVAPTPAPVQPASRVPSAVTPSTGSHWSVGIHDDEDPFENTFSREVGSATSLNTNALVLPEMPTGSIAGPVAGTGEIILTGMIDVSPLVSSTGAVPTLHDSPDIDDLFDMNDRDIAAPDSAPVSALKAISSHTASHTVMTGKSSNSNTVTTILVASTVVMAVVAIGLFVVAAANGLF